ncbi:hypothetical protein NQ317_001215 [Molorchus minor]|uniref:Uncharacterized protein n=1 Tax=Molorchus minor TaxID=1323400 RepID=A0ABQ9JSU8_9CUCU|nr:hypothetical protein NQ317_001215 [Molorchus minor]
MLTQRTKESIPTIPEMIRALPTFPEFSRFCPNSPEVRGIDCDYSRNDPRPPDFPDFSRSLKPPCLVSLLIFLSPRNRLRLFLKRSEHSRLFPNYVLSELSRRLETPCLVSFHIFLGARNRLRLFPKRSEPSRSCPNSPEAENHRVWCLYIYFQVRKAYIDRFERHISTAGRCVAAGHAVGSEAATGAAKPPAGSAQPTPLASQS